MSRLYCVIGYPVGHSLSPKLHNTWFRRHRLPCHYEAIEVTPQQLGSFMKHFREKYAGANVTIPHKQAVMPFLDTVSSEARTIGAVNTIVNSGERLHGYNTDVIGAMKALREVVPGSFRQKRAIVIGAGGAARAIIYGLKKAGARVVVLNRTLSHAQQLADYFKCEYRALMDISKQVAHGVDVIVNATSVGMRMSQLKSPVPKVYEILSTLKKKPVVMDIVYNPKITPFLRAAKRAGAPIITGEKMFLYQAQESFRLWTGIVL